MKLWYLYDSLTTITRALCKQNSLKSVGLLMKMYLFHCFCASPGVWLCKTHLYCTKKKKKERNSSNMKELYRRIKNKHYRIKHEEQVIHVLCYWQFLLTPVKTFVSDLNSPQIHAVMRENERLLNAHVSFVFCGHLFFFFFIMVVPPSFLAAVIVCNHGNSQRLSRAYGR